MVVKSDAASGVTSMGSWAFSGNTSAAHYAYNGTVYENIGITSRQSFTPTLGIGSWRVYRVQVSGTTWKCWLDGVLQATVGGVTPSWRTSSLYIGQSIQAGSYFFDGQIAELIAFKRALTDSEAVDTLAYLQELHW